MDTPKIASLVFEKSINLLIWGDRVPHPRPPGAFSHHKHLFGHLYGSLHALYIRYYSSLHVLVNIYIYICLVKCVTCSIVL